MSKERFEFDGLIVGDCKALEITVAEAQDIKRGDLLIASGDNFVKDTAGAEAGKVYCVAAEDVNTSDGAKTSVAYFSGDFSKEKVTEQASKASEYVLATQGIYLVEVR